MLSLYRRHQAPCPYSTRRYRNCKCPIWVQGSLRGEYIRRALDLRSWSATTDLVRDWEASGEIGVVKKPDIPTIAEAVDRFFADLTAQQQLSQETIRKHDDLLRKRMLPFAPQGDDVTTESSRVSNLLSCVQLRSYVWDCKNPSNRARS